LCIAAVSTPYKFHIGWRSVKRQLSWINDKLSECHVIPFFSIWPTAGRMVFLVYWCRQYTV
jgi:hypothetical protein